eukprot:CAMPEP_0114655618 /NCGR_PEP_ID=MMETSP0191-20121206/11237_1 /TAXON_ID=126664 /ORGANISM="Sorites sp." /LENGTH=152 /DNA_ID=CAMNT_0001871439 /DNA_START=4137 /DNA_END=4596 /DNA_ORIENTATION=+
MSCSVEKSVEKSTSISWEHSLETDKEHSVVVANGTSGSSTKHDVASFTGSLGLAGEFGGKFKAEIGIPFAGGEIGPEFEFKGTVEGGFEGTHEFGTDTETAQEQSMEESHGTTKITMTGVSNEESLAESISCSAEIEVDPNSMVDLILNKKY